MLKYRGTLCSLPLLTADIYFSVLIKTTQKPREGSMFERPFKVNWRGNPQVETGVTLHIIFPKVLRQNQKPLEDLADLSPPGVIFQE